ncbi:MAG: hypothetical protein MI725_01265 [Pirellulales bacterium]|nr:hypothetical protein [Pirellulales bacterium]
MEPVQQVDVLTFPILIILAGAAFFFLAPKLKQRPLAFLFGIGLVLLCLMFLNYTNVPEFRRADERPWVVEEQQFISSDLAATEGDSVEKLWSQLTTSKITLGGKEETSKQQPDAKPAKQQPERPDWVDKPPKRVGNVYREVVSSSRYSRVSECHRDLDHRLRSVMQQRITQLTGEHRFLRIERLGLGLDYVLREICQEEWIETVDSSVGEMKRVHVLMEFDAEDDRRLRQAYVRYRRGNAIEVIGVVAGLVLAGLALLYGLLKIDTWTRGYYTKRLFFGVPAAIILLIALIA